MTSLMGPRWRLREWGLAPEARRCEALVEGAECERGGFLFAFLGSNAGSCYAEGGSDGRCFCAPVLLGSCCLTV